MCIGPNFRVQLFFSSSVCKNLATCKSLACESCSIHFAMGKSMKVSKATSSKVMKAVTVKAKAKAKSAMKLTPKKLALLGQISLDEKVKQACESSETPEDAALLLKASLTKLESSKVWGQHQTHLKNNADAALALQDVEGKKSKGLAAALWFVSNRSTKFQSVQHSMSGNISVHRNDAWMSEKQAHDKFGAEELQAHLASGRVIWQEDPITRGVWRYKDCNDITRTQTVAKNKTLSRGEEYKPDEDEDKMFDELFEKDVYYFSFMFSEIFFISTCHLSFP